ncbi:putative F-box protein At3g23950 [Salvia hispanica]|uniref:putative F-box protein At3g23950 n=1 Tax=Salvia hispanica TaxID=49212 RepID=UPI00200940C0|nr:putative F-box protein At3g23950 [Salvia hispanica]
MNNDALTEILLHLPVQSLSRFRDVCKFWGGVIDSSYFRNLHCRNNNKSDDTGLRLTLPYRGDDRVSVYGPVKGLISIYCAKHISHIGVQLPCYPCIFSVPIAVCNPFLGQLKLLPIITSNISCTVPWRSVAIGYSEDDLKVVQLSWCHTHLDIHAHLYSRNTDSWRELPVDEDFGTFRIDPIKSVCENGHFAYWHVYFTESKIISFDMKKEVLSTIKLDNGLPDGVSKRAYVRSPIFAEDEHSFRRFHFDDELVHIYETRCDGSKLCWNFVMKVEIPVIEIMPRWRTGFVVIGNWTGESFVYDYRERKFICKLPKGLWIEGRGSFESLEKVNWVYYAWTLRFCTPPSRLR